jgi:hypothetical protein
MSQTEPHSNSGRVQFASTSICISATQEALATFSDWFTGDSRALNTLPNPMARIGYFVAQSSPLSHGPPKRRPPQFPTSLA